ncbi:hypothetical protein FC66_GL000512 [Dellaglioa algida DSM 15638]|uniref:PepSY domain-containing protein n=2 Tax=Dellaglioa algida TaxID=105612 RepID=A0A0R1HFE6_9LACO|nr:hypothetical protein FC66_GL000512 [Dellaglioa algida DSM 15638]
MTQSKAESDALAYFNSFQNDTNDWTPKVKSSSTSDLGDSFVVAVYDTETHFVEFDVNKSTGKVSSPNLGYQH